MNSASSVTLGSGLLLVVLVCACSRDEKATGSRALAQHVANGACVSYLDAEKDFEEIGTRLDGLAGDKSGASDEALVMLTGYYLGEHNDEELFMEIIRRGKRMKPLLTAQSQHPAWLKTCAPSENLKNIRSEINDMVGRIDKGERFD